MRGEVSREVPLGSTADMPTSHSLGGVTAGAAAAAAAAVGAGAAAVAGAAAGAGLGG